MPSVPMSNDPAPEVAALQLRTGRGKDLGKEMTAEDERRRRCDEIYAEVSSMSDVEAAASSTPRSGFPLNTRVVISQAT